LKQRTRQQILFLIVIVVVIALLFKRFHQAAGPQHPAPAPEAISCGVHCGTERWAVKTLSDASAAGVNFAATPVTVDWLVTQAQPAVLPEDQRISPVEDQAYVVTARLVGFKLEDDEDIHIVIADLNNPAETMIVEIPSSDCSGACFSTHLAEFVQARTNFEARFGTSHKRFERVPGNVTVTVTGVGFFDFLHHQTGVAPNGIELHPVLDIAAQ
jgi:hypothetical protein